MPRLLFYDFRIFKEEHFKKVDLTTLLEVACSHESLLVHGRYTKLSRSISQTPWNVMEGPNTGAAMTSVQCALSKGLTPIFEPAQGTKARRLENKSSQIPKAARRTNPDEGAGPETSTRAAKRPQARVRKLVRGLTKDKDFSVADGRKLAKQVQKDGISQREIKGDL